MAVPLLTLLTLPQRTAGGSLSLRFLLAPTGDPLAPMASGRPAFADLSVGLTIRFLAGSGGLPRPSDGDPLAAVDLPPAPQARALFEAMAAGLPIDTTPPPDTDPALSRLQILKVANHSYLAAVGAQRRNSRFLVDEADYACAMRAMLDDENVATPRSMATDITWNRIYAHLLRRVPFAEATGLIRVATIDLADPESFADGGFLWAEPVPGTSLAGLTTPQLKTYAARVPRTERGTDRPLFAAVLFPVAASPPATTAGAYDEIFAEAAAYDDGFAKAVHAFQPQRHDPAGVSGVGGGADQPIQDRGVRLGWDDEQILEWFNRQAAEDPRNPAPTQTSRDAPLAVAGYRVDVREAADEPRPWTSLVSATATLSLGGIALPDYTGEFFVQPSPSLQQRVGSGASARDQFWLLPHLARWAGGSLLAVQAADSVPTEPADEPAIRPDPIDTVPLRYGGVYDFRVRLADATGGGPAVDDAPRNAAPQSVARMRYRRFAPPGECTVERVAPDADGITRVRLWRPYISLPDALYVDSGHADPMAVVAADVPAAGVAGRLPGLPDPDVTSVRIDLMVASPDGDPLNEPSAGTPRRRLGTGVVARSFPDDPSAPLELSFRFVDAVSIDDLTTVDGPDIVLPTSRDVILILRPIARQDPAAAAAGRDDPVFAGAPDDPHLLVSDPDLGYFGCQAARVGPPTSLVLRAPARDERGLLTTAGPHPLSAVLVAPGRLTSGLSDSVAASLPAGAEGQSDVISRIATQLGLQTSGSTLIAPPDRSRTVVSCSPRIAHLRSPNASELTIGAGEALSDVWLVAIRLHLERDWTWDGLTALEIRRSEEGGGEELVGRVTIPRSVDGALGVAADRRRTEVVFVDRVATSPSGAPHPVERSVSYRVSAALTDAAADPPEDWSATIRLPIAVAPVDRPQLVSTGLAVGSYLADEVYSSTAPRERLLWLEFAEPPSNPADRLYGRVLAWAPDPLLGDGRPPLPETVDPALPLPEEPVRVIVPDQADDRAGATALQPLLPTTSDRCFLLPLPPGVAAGSAALLGFFCYEFRIGHGPSSWSTARARFGPPSRADGLRHPPPDLGVRTLRLPQELIVTAQPAQAANIDHPAPPRRSIDTEVWFLLYAQAPRADGVVMRNVLLSRRRGTLDEAEVQPGQVMHAQARWTVREVEDRLHELVLNNRSALSVLGVELLPTAAFRFADPLAGDLGEVRILRTSPLVPVPVRCVE